MRTILLVITCVCGDITPSIDDRFESENKASQVQTVPVDKAEAKGISAEEAKKLKPVAAEDVKTLIQKEGKETLLLGKVHSVYIPKSGSPVILNLGKDFKKCSKVVIEGRNFSRWKRDAVEIGKLYEGKTLLVEGTVSLYKELPQVEITSSSQVKIVD